MLNGQQITANQRLQRLRKKWKIYDWLTNLLGMKPMPQNMKRFSILAF